MKLLSGILCRSINFLLPIFLLVTSSFSSTESIIYSFQPLAHGEAPSGGLISDSAGNLYGVTANGGTFGAGTIFELTANASGGWTEHVLYSFAGTNGGTSDGGNPNGSLVFDAAGNLFGATTWGGTKGVGTIFELSHAAGGKWSEKVLWSFQHSNPKDGFNPQGGLAFDAQGNLYGTTRYGGGFTRQPCSFDGGCGLVFRLAPQSNGSWNETVLYIFQGTGDGAYPNDSLVLDQSGNIYGTTSELDSSSRGVVFKLSPSATAPWPETTLHSFGGGSDGSDPRGGVIFDQAGNLYGTTTDGGTIGACSANLACGSVYELSPVAGGLWTEVIIHSFDHADGIAPYGSLSFDSAGNLYGGTQAGGNSHSEGGVVYQLVPSAGGNWSENVLWNFGQDENPIYGVTVASSGHVFGVTGGAFTSVPGNGTVFDLSKDANGQWTKTNLANYPYADGGEPVSALIADALGNLYGTTSRGGTNGFGIVFELIPQSDGSWTKRTLFNFPSGGTAGPNQFSNASTLVFDASGDLFVGTTYGGTAGVGAVYELTPDPGHPWISAVIYSFKEGVGGSSPVGNLVFDASGNLYGTTSRGGSGAACPQGCGTVYQLSPQPGQWNETVLYSFQGGNDGRTPMAGLVFDASGNLFGTTRSGGFNGQGCGGGCGTVFELSPSLSGGWSERVLYSFTNEQKDGAFPEANLIVDGSGNLFGVTSYGGTHDSICTYAGCGTVFELSPASGSTWIKKSVYRFDRTDGYVPLGSLIMDSAGNLLGTTESGGPNFVGIAFQLSPKASGGWRFTALHSFAQKNDGANPWAGLLLDQSGVLYGTTAGGGVENQGSVFRILR